MVLPQVSTGKTGKTGNMTRQIIKVSTGKNITWSNDTFDMSLADVAIIYLQFCLKINHSNPQVTNNMLS